MKKAPPAPPLDRILKYEGAYGFCSNCHSTCRKMGLFGLFGKVVCDNKDCPKSKTS